MAVQVERDPNLRVADASPARAEPVRDLLLPAMFDESDGDTFAEYCAPGC